MIPQAPNTNHKTWECFETYLRAQALNGYEVYVSMSSYGTGGIGAASASVVNTINNGKVTVPANVWKVAVLLKTGDNDISCVTNATRVIAINTPNINSTSANWKDYIVTVRGIKNATGYNLLSNLPQNIQDVVEKLIDPVHFM